MESIIRECGDCNLCCTLVTVPELNKKEGTKCKYCIKNCTIYDTRPKSCKEYFCEWAKGNIPISMKPNKVHFIMEKLPDIPVVIVVTEKNYKEYPLDYEDIFKEYNKNGIAVVVTHNKMAMLPANIDTETAERYILLAAKKMGYINGST